MNKKKAQMEATKTAPAKASADLKAQKKEYRRSEYKYGQLTGKYSKDVSFEKHDAKLAKAAAANAALAKAAAIEPAADAATAQTTV